MKTNSQVLDEFERWLSDSIVEAEKFMESVAVGELAGVQTAKRILRKLRKMRDAKRLGEIESTE